MKHFCTVHCRPRQSALFDNSDTANIHLFHFNFRCLKIFLQTFKMLAITYVSFAVLGALCVALQLWVIKTRKEPSIGNNPTFLQFQRGYFATYFLALLADWLQGPYLYRLYSHYGFQEDQIAVLYVCGFLSSVLLGTWAPIAADRFGRKKLCILFTIIYSVACFFKLSRNYGILILGKVLGGVATSLLFSSFEAWYVQEHLDKHDFPKEWIAVTSNKASMWSSILAIVAGVVTNVVAEWMKFGPVAPYILAVPCLIASGVIVLTQWDENYAKQKPEFARACAQGFKVILSEPKIFVLGIIQSFFESAMYIFIFLWTPILAPAKPSFGITFSSFMVCIMIGNAIFQVAKIKGVPALQSLTVSIISALIGYIMCVGATRPYNPNSSFAFTAFLIIEISVGMYFPAMNIVRNKVLPEANRRSVLNWFQVPLNLLACAALMMLHNDAFRHGNRLLFVTCVGFLGVATVCTIKFTSMVKNDEEFMEEEIPKSEQNNIKYSDLPSA